MVSKKNTSENLNSPKVGFDSQLYERFQINDIVSRLSMVDRLYLEIGGKLSYDSHASRVLPGFNPDAKIRAINHLHPFELIYCIGAPEVEKAAIRSDTGTTYGDFAIAEISDLIKNGIKIAGIVVSRYTKGPRSEKLIERLNKINVPVFTHPLIAGFPENREFLLQSGLKRLPQIPVSSNLVIVAGVASFSGKMGVCISQIYHEPSDLNVGFAKWETFPVWNLPIDHPVNLSVDAAVAHEDDPAIIDPYHKTETGFSAVSYLRDVRNFELLAALLSRRNAKLQYTSPTQMCINNIYESIISNPVVCEASKQEIIRRYFHFRQKAEKDPKFVRAVNAVSQILQKHSINLEERLCYKATRHSDREEKQITAIELKTGEIIEASESAYLTAEAALLIKIAEKFSIKPITQQEIQLLSQRKYFLNPAWDSRLTFNDVCLASIIGSEDYKCLIELKDCEMHSTNQPKTEDLTILHRMGIRLTWEYDVDKSANYF